MNFKGRKFPYYFEKDMIAISKEVVRSGVQEILKVGESYFDKPLKTLKVLDTGSGRGEYSLEMSKYFKKVIGVEPFEDAYSFAVKNIPKKIKNLSFYYSNLENFSSKEKFDLIVILTVFEHLQNPQKTFNRALSLLKKDGIIYLTAPNKYWLFEQHMDSHFYLGYRFPLLIST